MWLPNALIKDVGDADVRVFYVSYAATRRWAAGRDPGEPLVFSGWYWAIGARESGPFKSQSAAWRDAWYRVVRRRGPPGVAKRNDLFESETRAAANAAAVKRRGRRKAKEPLTRPVAP